MDVLIEDISQCCIKVYTLEKVLRRKKDSVTQVDFLTEAMKVSPITLLVIYFPLMISSAARREAILHILDDPGDVFRRSGTIGIER